VLRELTEAFGVSSEEHEVRSIIKTLVAKYCDRIFEDDFGNLFVVKGKKGKRLMLLAHMDEIGVMIIGIEKSGLLRFRPVGGIDPRVFLGKSLLITKDRIPGVIGHKPVHFTKEEERKKAEGVESMFIDIGANSKEEAERHIKIGDYGIFATKYREDGDIIMGKAFDDRLGCYVLTEIMKRNFDAQIIGVFTVQEEIGTRGAKIAGFRMKPDCALAIEVTSTNDLPKDDKDVNRAPFLAKGPAITVTDQSIICDRGLVDIIIKTAERNNIPYQLKPPMIGGTDAGGVHLQRGGIKAAVISIPVRYIHSPCSIGCLSDLALTTKLMPLLIAKIIKEVKCN